MSDVNKITHLRWKNLNLRRKRKIFKVVHEDVKQNGFKVPVFDYLSYQPYANAIDSFMKHCKYMGMNKKSIIKRWNEKTGMMMK